MHRATLRLAFDDAEQAARMLASLAPDDDGSCVLAVEGAALLVTASSATPLGLLRTLDELLAQVTAAQKVERAAAESTRA